MTKSRFWTLAFAASSFLAALGAEQAPSPSIRVAAVQCHSRIGDTHHNRALLAGLVTQAATNGARIVVMPECALSGYMDPERGITWTTNAVTGSARTDRGPEVVWGELPLEPRNP